MRRNQASFRIDVRKISEETFSSLTENIEKSGHTRQEWAKKLIYAQKTNHPLLEKLLDEISFKDIKKL